MKKADKIAILQKGIDETLICRCHFTYSPDYWYYYPLAVSDKLMLGVKELDFLLDGYGVRKLSQLKKVEVKDDLCGTISKMFGITDGIVPVDADISGWKALLESLKDHEGYITIQNEIEEELSIGIVERIGKSSVQFRRFDADGIWDESPVEIRFSEITAVEWGDRYAAYWKRYMEQTGKD